MNPYLILILGFLIGTWLLGLVVERLNLRAVRTRLPEEFAGFYDPAEYRRSQEYLRESTRFGMLAESLQAFLTLAFILAGGFNLADGFVRGFGLTEIPAGLLFSALLLLCSQGLAIPLSAYSTFVIEEKFGFNRTTPRTFVLDILKGWLLAALLGGTLLAAVLWIFQQAGPRAWLWCWAAVSLFEVFVLFLAPVLVLPLFNRFEALEPGRLREAIEEYVRAQGFRLRGVFTMDGSRRSARSNAFFAGFGRFRRIVLFDTLLAKHPARELLAVIAHETGHCRLKHVPQSLLLSVLTTGLMLFILSRFIRNPGLFAAFGMEHISLYAGLFFFGFLYSPLQTVISVLGKWLSRRNEYAADAFAVRTLGDPEAMVAALKKLSVDNLSNLTPHPLKVLLDYSHPPVLARIRAIRALAGVVPKVCRSTPPAAAAGRDAP